MAAETSQDRAAWADKRGDRSIAADARLKISSGAMAIISLTIVPSSAQALKQILKASEDHPAEDDDALKSKISSLMSDYKKSAIEKPVSTSWTGLLVKAAAVPVTVSLVRP